MFTYADGRAIRPEYLTHRFQVIIRELGLPPIRLHDLRHCAATLALASRTDLKVIQQMLGHSSIVTTADTYTTVLPEAAHRAAQATADMINKAARSRAPGSRSDMTALPHRPPSPPPATARCELPQLNRLLHRNTRLTARARRHQAGRPRVTQECPIRAPQMTKAL
jgi:hypothetical protein